MGRGGRSGRGRKNGDTRKGMERKARR